MLMILLSVFRTQCTDGATTILTIVRTLALAGQTNSKEPARWKHLEEIPSAKSTMVPVTQSSAHGL